MHSSSSISSVSSVDAHPLDNPFVGARWYVDPIWSAKARAEVGGDKVARFNTAVWMDRIGAIDPAEGFGLRDHLDAALEQGANLIQVVVYDLPNRDCHALASNGELKQGADGSARYRTEYIDALAAIFSDSKYRNLRIIAIIEPDSLPNLVTNLSDPDCQLATDATHGYVANTQYTLNKLSQIPNVYSYVDIGHSGWLGWDDNFSKAVTLIGNAIKGTTNGVRSIAGFVSNTSGYTPVYEPFLDSLANSAMPGSGGGTQVRQAKFYEWNPQFSEVGFVQAWRTKMIAAGFPQSIGMLIDTSRNGWGGPDRPTAQSTSTQVDTFVNESRVDRRIHRGNWCNQPGGIGERPQATPAPGIDAYVWVKPPGESDGASSLELSFDPLDPAKGFDRMCDPTYTYSEGNNSNLGTGALANAPVAGRWFPEAFQLLVRNAYPPLTEAPASSSAASSSSLRSSSVPSSIAASSIAPSSVAPSSIAASSIAPSSIAASSIAPSSVASSVPVSSSSVVSSVIRSSSSSANQAPVVNLSVAVYGSTILVNGSTSTDADNDELTYLIDFGDDQTIRYPEAWHTYAAAGSQTVTLTVSDGKTSTTATKTISTQATIGNRAPIAMLSTTRSNLNVVAYGSASFDEDGDGLSYEWDFDTAQFSGNSAQVYTDCESSSSVAVPRLVTLTVHDGELGDTRQVSFNQPCGLFEEKISVAEFSYRVEGNTLYVDGRNSRDTVFLAWDFGDGNTSTGLIRSHTFAAPGVYPVKLTAYGDYMHGEKTVEISVGQIASSVSSSAVGSSSSSPVLSSSSSIASSSIASSSSSSSAPDVVRTDCPAAPPATQFGSWAPYNTNDESQKVVKNFRELMVKMPAFNNGNITLPYNLHQPAQAAVNPQAKYPLVIYLHGGGERGSNEEHLTSRHALPFFASSNSLLTPENRQNKPAYIVAPQCQCEFFSNEWSSGGGAPFSISGNPSRYGKALTDLIEHLKATYQIDPDRIYVTGISMGGGGSWELAARRPDLIAAAVPMSGHPVSSNHAQAVANSKVVIWPQQGEGDENNSITDTENTVNAIRTAGGCATMNKFPRGTTEMVDPGDPPNGNDLQHTVWMRAYMNPQLWDYVFSVKRAHVGTNGSSSSTSVSSSIRSSISSSTLSSVPVSSLSSSASTMRSSSSLFVSSSRSSSSVMSSSSSSVADRNLYIAPKAQVAPEIDGTIDAIWDRATWAPIDVFWLGTQPNPTAQDYSGRYKALWDENYLYLLFDITDERIYDHTRDALSNYWEDDTVELFIDENKNGGQHQYNTSAWAYHISTYGDVVDYTTSGPKLLNDHIDVRLVSMGDKHVWEMRVRIYGETYADNRANTPLVLSAGKLMGFSASYIDNDGTQQRQSMMGSVDTPGHRNNQGYIDASVFGSLRLVE